MHNSQTLFYTKLLQSANFDIERHAMHTLQQHLEYRKIVVRQMLKTTDPASREMLTQNYNYVNELIKELLLL